MKARACVPTLEDIQTQLQHADLLLVVADNCVDDTAAIARTAGAEVIERHEPTRIGKGFALDFALKHLSSDPPAIIIVIDADCRLEPDAINQLAMTCATTRRPVQALYLMTIPERRSINYRVAEFAWRIKNWVRPLGLNALGLPCQLMGTGMAFPWNVIRSVDLATASIVEDLKLGLDLAEQGAAPLFCPSAVVKSQFPVSVEGAEQQRTRWEAGHVRMIFTKLLPCTYTAITKRNPHLLVLALDLAIPPLSLLVMLLGAVVILCRNRFPLRLRYRSADHRWSLFGSNGVSGFPVLVKMGPRHSAAIGNTCLCYPIFLRSFPSIAAFLLAALLLSGSGLIAAKKSEHFYAFWHLTYHIR